MSNFETIRDVGIIEENIEIIKNSWLYNDEQNVKFVNAIEHILKDYTRQKQINEEHRKENGGLREKVKELDTKNDELLKDVYSANCIIADLTDSIPKQKIKNKIEELIIQGNYKTFYNPNGRTHFLKEESDYKIEVLEELLQEENK